MIFLGIDPGYAIVGYGVVRVEGNRFSMLEYGAATTQAGERMPARLNQIYEQISAVMARYPIDEMAIEELFFNTNSTTAIAVGQGRGVVLLAAERAGLPVFEYTPLQVKQGVCGYGRAEKKQVMEMTRRLLALEKIPRPDDAADALAIAICHANLRRNAASARVIQTITRK